MNSVQAKSEVLRTGAAVMRAVSVVRDAMLINRNATLHGWDTLMDTSNVVGSIRDHLVGELLCRIEVELLPSAVVHYTAQSKIPAYTRTRDVHTVFVSETACRLLTAVEFRRDAPWRTLYNRVHEYASLHLSTCGGHEPQVENH